MTAPFSTAALRFLGWLLTGFATCLLLLPQAAQATPAVALHYGNSIPLS